MTPTLQRQCLLAVASFSALALVAACSGSPVSGSLSPTGPSASVSSSVGDSAFRPNPTDPPPPPPPPPDPCVSAPALRGFDTNPTDPPPPPPPPPALCDGRFTGGGFQIDANELKVTRGFTLHCDALLSNNFEVNWKSGGTAHNFHTDKNPEVTECSKPVVPNPPTADVSRIVILNQPGSLDGEDGHLITIVLEDHGEPGTEDRAYIAVDGVALTGGSVAVPALIDGGNIQAHLDQPHKN